MPQGFQPVSWTSFKFVTSSLTFDIVTGAFDAIDFRGIDGIRLTDKWSAGPRTYLGLTVQHFPNMFMSIGPHQAYGNIPRSIEYAVGWIADCIEYMENHDLKYIEATEKGVSLYFNALKCSKLIFVQATEWTEHVHDLGKDLLSNTIDSWLTGVNKNVASQQKRIIARYSGAAPDFRRTCDAVAAAHYDAFTLE